MCKARGALARHRICQDLTLGVPDPAAWEVSQSSPSRIDQGGRPDCAPQREPLRKGEEDPCAGPYPADVNDPHPGTGPPPVPAPRRTGSPLGSGSLKRDIQALGPLPRNQNVLGWHTSWSLVLVVHVHSSHRESQSHRVSLTLALPVSVRPEVSPGAEECFFHGLIKVHLNPTHQRAPHDGA